MLNMYLYQHPAAVRIKEVVCQWVHAAASCCGEKCWPHITFWASCLQGPSIRIHLQNAPCLPASSKVFFVFRSVILHKVLLQISVKTQGILGNPLELRKAEVMTWQSIFDKLTFRIYSFLVHVSAAQSSRHKWHISNGVKVVPEEKFSFIFSPFKNCFCNTFKITCTIVGSSQMSLISRCIFLKKLNFSDCRYLAQFCFLALKNETFGITYHCVQLLFILPAVNKLCNMDWLYLNSQ